MKIKSMGFKQVCKKFRTVGELKGFYLKEGIDPKKTYNKMFSKKNK